FTPRCALRYSLSTRAGSTRLGSSAGTATLTPNGSVPHSSAEGPLAAASYSFQASYSGDSNYASKSVCEPFSVGQLTPTVSTIVFDSSTNAAWSGSEVTGASANDTATVSGSGPTPSGTVTYTFYANGGCTGSGASEAVTMTN